MQYTFTFEGNLGSAPELRFTPSGVAVAKMSVGHNTRRRTADGKWVNGPTLWIDVTCWRELAERVAQLRKGDTVVVDARDDLSAWAYLAQSTEKPAARLQVTANNVAVSMRFAEATASRTPRAAATDDMDDPWAGAEPTDVPDSPAAITEMQDA
ncbi:single-stranded DNA-binding protein [Spirilliplanes yamanashiensis]|uniref:Single-stranded DNA-binding protein n=1 Tax=Spirilliplanes yamanashiensis TaxID=42233 RepID=A0A8J3YEU9_9ACTN|nr:single-stranded DNA-binding protein [Spirilliplanes yamanashiensis]MDP9818482.1 single-strand DNA-binding protein [Spirilliplanes yamanashiensis]GIJ06392.1 single-stranded DNA-binding protein [Spirilliplanes yamanashiensis]